VAAPSEHSASKPFAGIGLAFFALLVLALAWGEYFSPLNRSTFPLILTQGKAGPAIGYVDPRAAATLRVAAGDAVDLTGLSLSARMRLQMGSPAGTTLTVPVEHDGVWSPRTLVSEPRPFTLSWRQVPFLFTATFSLLVLALIAARRPSIATAALVFFGCGTVTVEPFAAEFSWLPDPLFGAVAALVVAAFADLPLFALIVFVTRFPHAPRSPAARARARAGDGLFVVAAIAVTVLTLREPILFESWSGAYTLLDGIGTIATIIFAVLAYRDASGEERRRIGWVLAGFCVSAAAFFFNDLLFPKTFGSASDDLRRAVRYFADVSQCALPLALAYAVLRHRVIDVGFALNRTLVYAVLTGAGVVVIGFVDWLSGKLISEGRLALAAEALVTIGFGALLNSLHARVERLIDRAIFRARYVAQSRIEHRIAAMAFATSEATIDAALTDDAASVLDLSSAAVFRRDDASRPFARRRAMHWPADASLELDDESLLVRTLRAVERPLFLADLAIDEPALPTGPAAPALAIPIATLHEVLGVVLYGNERDGGSPDPEIVALLAKLAAAAGGAYTMVEARRWRERAAELERAIVGNSAQP
jgi:hypothetical protein